jgi:hypothetical protein
MNMLAMDDEGLLDSLLGDDLDGDTIDDLMTDGKWLT